MKSAVARTVATKQNQDAGRDADKRSLAEASQMVKELVDACSRHNQSADKAAVSRILPAVRAMLDVLGLDPLSSQWSDSGSTGELRGVVDSLVALALEQRAAARTRKDWAAADAVRDQLKAAGIVVEDTPTGPRWTVETTGGA